MSPEGGFYYDGVKSIEQDKDGFVWIAMDYELYRFDGFQYKKYYPYFASMSHTDKWVFRHVVSDALGRVFVNTDNGIYLYNATTDGFERVFDRVITLKVDKRNNIWVWYNNLWSILNVDAGTLDTPSFESDSVSYVNSIFCLHNNDLYVFSGLKVYRYNYVKNEFIFCFKIPVEGDYVRSAQAHQGKLWLYMNKHGLCKIDLSTFHTENQFDILSAQNDNTYRLFHIDKKGYIWIGTINGLYILDPETEKYSYYKHSETDPFSLPNNSIWTINEDRQRNIWIGTYSGALCYVNLDDSDAFKTFLPTNSKLSHTPVSTFAEDGKYVWIGTEGGGINRMNKSTGEFQLFTSQQGLSSNNVKSLLIDQNQNLWASMFMGGLLFWETGKDKKTTYNHLAGQANSLRLNNVRKSILEGDSGIWVAYQYNKPEISYFSYQEKSFTHFKLDSLAVNSFIFDILKQGERFLWAVSHEMLYRLDIVTRKVDKAQPNDSTYRGLYTLCADDSGNIWIGTIGNGLMKFDPNTFQFVLIKDLLPNSIYSIYSICYDEGNIWMGTDNGLYCYNIDENDLLRFDASEGTQGQVYYPLATMKGKNGKLYFGGTKGFTIVDPRKISRNKYKPKVMISNFYIDHKSSNLPGYSCQDSVAEIILNYDQTNFGFQFSSDNYHIPQKNLFKYRLKGYDNRWMETDASNRTAMYSKVPAGTYYFEVYAANNDGVWGDIPKVIKIKRKPAPWLSWPAYIGYFLLFAVVLYMIYRYYHDKKKLEMQLYLDHVEKDKKEQIHQSQLRFFTNISHDFRTPLSLILAAVDKLKQEGLKDYYYRILNGNAQRLLNLVNELMQFRTIENGKMKLEVSPVDVNQVVSTLTSDFKDYARQQEIHYQVQLDPELTDLIYLDKSVFEKILMNLINNAFKYTGKNGEITIETYNQGKTFKSNYKSSFTVNADAELNAYFSVVIRDTGIGISEKSIENVFERFYKVNTQNTEAHLGTGIGLALVKSLVLLHKGSITLYSEREVGTDIEVRLPLDPAVYGETEIQVGQIDETEEQVPDQDQNSVAEVQEIFRRNKKRILIVEDNTDLLKLIADYISIDYEVAEAQDGVEATEKLSEMEIDLIISDIMMPRKDGITFCQEVKANMETSHIPVILLTAKTGTESQIEGAYAGADIYFEKPIDLSLLLLSVNNMFEHQRKLKEYYSKNFYVDSPELSANEQDNKFLKQLIDIIDKNMDQPTLDVTYIASELSMSRSKLYTKIKALTDKSIIEFILNYKLKRAARFIIEEDVSMRQIMERIGIESQAYFTNAFKKEFGETPTSFASKYRSKNKKK